MFFSLPARIIGTCSLLALICYFVLEARADEREEDPEPAYVCMSMITDSAECYRNTAEK